MAQKLKIELIVDDKGSVTVKQFGKTTETSLKKTGRSIEDADKKTKSWLKSWQGMSLIAAAATGIVVAKLGQAGGAAIAAASAAEETSSKFAVVFEGQEARAKAWSKTLVDSYAMSTRESEFFLSSIQDLLVPMGMQADAAGKMSYEVVKLSADLGSFNDLPTAQVMLDIQSALVGNFETMKKYGVVLNATVVQERALAMGLAATKDELTAGHKAQAAYALMVEGSAAAVGDMERTSEGYANQLKALKAQFEDVVVALGEKLIPAATGVIGTLGKLLDTTLQLSEETALEEWAEKAGEQISEFIKFTEKSVEAIIDWWGEIKTTAKILAELLIIGKITILLKDAIESIYAFSAALTIAESRQVALNTATKAFLPVLVAYASFKAGEWFTDWSEGISKNIKTSKEWEGILKRLQEQLETTTEVKPDLTAAEVYSEAWQKAYEEKLAAWFAATKEEEKAAVNALKAQEKAAKELIKIYEANDEARRQILERFQDDFEKSTLSNYEFQLRTLDEQYVAYYDHIHDKTLLDQWYASQVKRLQEKLGLFGFMGGDWAAAWSSIVGTAQTVMGIAKATQTIIEMPSKVVDSITSLLDSIGNFASNLVKSLDKFIDSVFNMIVNLGDIFTKLIPKLITLPYEIVLGIVKALPDFIQAFVDSIPLIIDAHVKQVPRIILEIIESIPAIIKALTDAIPQITRAFIDAIPDIIAAFIESIPEIAKALADAVFESVKSAFTGFGIADTIGGGGPGVEDVFPFFDPTSWFHDGGLVKHAGGVIPYAHQGLFLGPKLRSDERHIIGLTGEGIINRGGMQDIGGEAGLNAINRGDLGSGIGGDVHLHVNVNIKADVVAGRDGVEWVADMVEETIQRRIGHQVATVDLSTAGLKM